LKFNFRGDRISDGKSKKNDGLSHILKNKALINKKASTEVLYTNYTGYIKIQVNFKIEP
jgi:hypothetical protein